MNTIDRIINNKIGILGLGDENIALIKYLISKGAKNITICDQKGREELNEKKCLITNDKCQISYRLGKTYLDNIKDFDIVFRSPGLPYLNEKIQQAKKDGVEISSAIKLFFQSSPSPIIGVTGTKGKGTTASLIYKILANSKRLTANGNNTAVSCKPSAVGYCYLAGNIGNSPFEFLKKLTKDDIVILELSSFQLQDMDKSPHIAVVLDIKSDHLDYHISQDEYLTAKQNIVKFQTKNDYAIINTDYEQSKNFENLTKAKKYYFSIKKEVMGIYYDGKNILLNMDNKKETIINQKDIILRGQHNLENISAASLASYLSGADLKNIKNAIMNFPGLEHRLEFIREIKGIKFYNDSFSTTPDTTIAAINSFSEPIILICGGSEKNANYEELGKAILNSSVKCIILIGKTGPRIESRIKNQELRIKNSIKIINKCRNMDDIIIAIKQEMKSGDVVLLSPASASFDWFNNYKERGEIFKKEINNIK